MRDGIQDEQDADGDANQTVYEAGSGASESVHDAVQGGCHVEKRTYKSKRHNEITGKTALKQNTPNQVAAYQKSDGAEEAKCEAGTDTLFNGCSHIGIFAAAVRF